MNFKALLFILFPILAFAQLPQRTVEGMHNIRATKSLQGLSNMPCKDGKADVYPCNNVDLLSFMTIEELGGKAGDLTSGNWGWTDSQTGKEYAIVGMSDATAFVDITNPIKPILVGRLPMHAGGKASIWREIKTYNNYAFTAVESGNNQGMQVFDLTQLRTFTNTPITFSETAHYAGVGNIHTITIDDESGFAYLNGSNGTGNLCGGGFHIVDIRDPKNPKFVNCYAEPRTGRRGTGYTHDAQCVKYKGPDKDYTGKQICIAANETAVAIADVTDKANPRTISIANYPNVGYAHQGWFDDTQRYWFLDDETDELTALVNTTRTIIFDFEDLDKPKMLLEYFAPVPSPDHNQYPKGTYLYQGNYSSGMRVIDFSDINKPFEAGFFDTYPLDNGVNFNGCWAAYPYYKSNNVIATSRGEGLFVLKPTLVKLANLSVTDDLDGNALEWAVASLASPPQKFIVERSYDGTNYVDVGSVAFKTANETYRYKDVFIPEMVGKTISYRLKLDFGTGSTPTTGAASVKLRKPAFFQLAQVYPNPVTTQALLNFSLPKKDIATILLFDTNGRLVKTILDEVRDQGFHQVLIETAGLSSGTYLATLQTHFSGSQTVKLVVQK